MVYCKVSRDLKLAAVRMHDQQILSVDNIINCLQMSRHIFYWVLDLWMTTGDVVQCTYGVRGRPRILHLDDKDYLWCIIRHQTDWFLDELLDLLETNRFISAHYTTIHRELECAGVSTKKLNKIALKRNENLRADICSTWLVTHWNSLVSWMRSQRMKGLQQGLEAGPEKVPTLSKKESSFVVDISLLKAY